jgi:hypothetical protein
MAIRYHWHGGFDYEVVVENVPVFDRCNGIINRLRGIRTATARLCGL